ncbi:sensor histidine kinase [Mycobacteroides franklinii]|uniref:histidine kinase n=1 Tax=Mycobacteroides franklinii TaxID=948102 RepID=A0A4R5PBJ8_9MYCO|nr:HAMP domain-containing sensor histidine kinase [Mycobacteroides franklinii]ORA60696.1 two-component sensor histidine kinase [Mycobacteroides franklinii]TDH22129.1 HAMP domain-containing histidine kinase [Mycobacteroides franklinii]
MSSNLPTEVTPRFRKPSAWSLRARLLAVQVTLLALVCVGIGAGTMLAMNRFLIQQLDEQVRDAGVRSVTLFNLGPPPPMPGVPRLAGPGPIFLDAPGQSTGTVGAVLRDGRVVEAAVITTTGARERLTDTAYGQLAAIEEGGCATAALDGLGKYRLIRAGADDGTTIVTGLPTAGVDSTLVSVLAIFCVVGAVALTAAVVAGVVVIRRQLAPLSDVASAALEVVDMPLERGEVNLPSPIVAVPPAQVHTEIGKLGTALNRMLERISDALSARQASETRVRQFVADASHELRTPLAAISGYTELAQRNSEHVPADVAHAMGRVASEAARMTELVSDLLLLARLDSGRPLEQARVDLSQLIVDAVSDAHIAAPEHNWSVQLPDEPVVLVGDQARLHQVLANLLSNCRIHTPPGTTITVGLMAEDDHIRLTVSDDGPGIPTGQQSEIFERFARGDTSRSRRGGSTGLGLAIAAAVVKAHRGVINVRSVPGSTAFTATLPSVSP